MANKTEAPTPRRLRRAREQGDIPVTPGAARSLGLAVGVTLLPGAFTLLGLRGVDLFRRALREPGNWRELLSRVYQDLSLILLPWLLAIGLAGVAITWLQTRRLLTWQRVAPQSQRLSMGERLNQWFNGQSWASAALAAAGAAAFLMLTVVLARQDLQSFAHAAQRPLDSVPLTFAIIERTAWAAVCVGALLALSDWGLRFAAWRTRLRMTRAELLDEQRQTYGAPAVREERARRQRSS